MQELKETTQNLEELLNRLSPEFRAKVKQASEAEFAPPGYLTAADVCRLFIGPHWEKAMASAAATCARNVIRERKLPLIELGSGKWQVAHVIF